MEWCVAIYAGGRNTNNGWNCGGSYINKADAIESSKHLYSLGIRVKLLYRLPWCGTINL